jgi:hypothetical protein
MFDNEVKKCNLYESHSYQCSLFRQGKIVERFNEVERIENWPSLTIEIFVSRYINSHNFYDSNTIQFKDEEQDELVQNSSIVVMCGKMFW